MPESTTFTPQDARWADDDHSVDYFHLRTPFSPAPFHFDSEVLAKLCRLNYFDLHGGQDEILFGLRGCRVVGEADGAFQDAVTLAEDLPDHIHFHCVLGVWKQSTGQVSVFKGSTVPNWFYMIKQVGNPERVSNMLATGRHVYRVGTHSSENSYQGCFLNRVENIVLRSRTDLIYERSDDWTAGIPGDNIHPAFTPKEADFSSAGCQTIEGRVDPATQERSGLWRTFCQRAGLSDTDLTDRYDQDYVYLLLTGREARLAASGAGAELTRLRYGSAGEAVRALQSALAGRGLYTGECSGQMDAATVMAYIAWQKRGDPNAPADAVVTPQAARLLGVGL